VTADARRLVDKMWSYCNVLRDDGVSTIEYTEQLLSRQPRNAWGDLPQGAEPDPGSGKLKRLVVDLTHVRSPAGSRDS
jgi:hypothetical protein